MSRQNNSQPYGNRATLDRLIDSGQIEIRRGEALDVLPPAMPDDGIWHKVEGMLLGLAIGDSLGNTTEGLPPGERGARFGEIRDYLPHPHAAGERVGLPSDDTQLAFWTLEHLLTAGRLEPQGLARRFCEQRIYGIGATVRAFIGNHRDECRPWHESGVRSAGNGAIMRIAPVILPHLASPTPELWADAAIAAAITHNDPAAIGSCVAFVRVLWEALRMSSPPDPRWWVDTFCSALAALEGETRYASRSPHVAYEGPMWRFVQTQVGEALDRRLTVREACDRWYSGAYLLETLPSVLYILCRHAHEPEEAIVRAVNDTYDNDTTAAVVGAAVGALHGRSALPRRWIDGLLGRTGSADDGRVFELIDHARRALV